MQPRIAIAFLLLHDNVDSCSDCGPLKPLDPFQMYYWQAGFSCLSAESYTSYMGAISSHPQKRIPRRNHSELSRTDLSKGNMSLILKKTHLNDQGNYTCIVFLGDWYEEVVVELLLAGEFILISLIIRVAKPLGYHSWQIQCGLHFNVDLPALDIANQDGNQNANLFISEDKERASLQTLPPEKEETALRSQIFVGKEGYAAGKHYWEVEVGERLDWELGVLTKAERYKFRVEKVVKSFGEGCWALKSIQGKFFSSPCEKEIEKKENVSYSVIGLLLDQEKWEISFYNSRGAYFLIDSIPIKSSDKLYPFLDCGSASENSGPKPSEKSNVSENSGPKTLRKSFANIVKKYLLEK
uniref:B30.2/SPRY domain-containing protein n=1 Tax=Podarcis muralis TaxID=64176 RepID=A0A670JKQ1_PODMU